MGNDDAFDIIQCTGVFKQANIRLLPAEMSFLHGSRSPIDDVHSRDGVVAGEVEDGSVWIQSQFESNAYRGSWPECKSSMADYCTVPQDILPQDL